MLAAPAATAPDPKPARPAGGKATPAPPSGANQKVGPKEAAAKATAPQKANASKQANGASAASTTTAAPGPIARVPTSLEQVLAIGEAPAADRALAASIVRTLGGADDARSPRAPGLLDRIARTPEISPDTLAMAGWVSPFGANRSGWLNLARSRAAAENDRLTLAFAQRRIAASNLSSNLADWALSTSREEPLASAKDPEARLIRALVKKQLAGGGVLRRALDDLLAIADEQKNRTPLAVTAEVAAAARSLQPLVAHRALRRLAETRAESRGAAFVRSFKGGDGASLEIAAAQSLKHQTQALDLVQIGRDLYEAGRYAWAREAFYLATKLAPNRAPAFEWLATARNAAATYEKQDAQTAARERTLATAAVARARDLEPSDPALKSELSFRTSGGAKEAADRVRIAKARGLRRAEARRSPSNAGERRGAHCAPPQPCSSLCHARRDRDRQRFSPSLRVATGQMPSSGAPTDASVCAMPACIPVTMHEAPIKRTAPASLMRWPTVEELTTSTPVRSRITQAVRAFWIRASSRSVSSAACASSSTPESGTVITPSHTSMMGAASLWIASRCR